MRILARFAFWELWIRTTERELTRAQYTNAATWERFLRRMARLDRLQHRIARILRRTR